MKNAILTHPVCLVMFCILAPATACESSGGTVADSDSSTGNDTDTETDSVPPDTSLPDVVWPSITPVDTPETFLHMPGYSPVVAGAVGEFALAGRYVFGTSLNNGRDDMVTFSGSGIFLSRFSQTGDLLMTAQVTGNSGEPRAIAYMENDDLLLVGTMTGDLTFHTGLDTITLPASETAIWDSFVARFNADGNLVWVEKISTDDQVRVADAAVFENGDFVITGSYAGNTVFGEGQPLEETLTSVVVGEFNSGGVFTARYGGDGTLQWVRAGRDAYPNTDRQPASNSILVHEDGSCTAVGTFDIRIHFWDGQMVEELYSYASDGLFLVRYDEDGAIADIRRSYSDYLGETTGIQASRFDDDSLLVTGDFRRRIFFGAYEPNETIVTSIDEMDFDMYIGHYAPDLSLNWVKTISGMSNAWTNDVTAVATLADGSGLLSGTITDDQVVNPDDCNAVRLDAVDSEETIFLSRYGSTGTVTGILTARAPSIRVVQMDRMNEYGFILTGIISGNGTFFPDASAPVTVQPWSEESEIYVYLGSSNAFDATVESCVPQPDSDTETPALRRTSNSAAI